MLGRSSEPSSNMPVPMGRNLPEVRPGARETIEPCTCLGTTRLILWPGRCRDMAHHRCQRETTSKTERPTLRRLVDLNRLPAYKQPRASLWGAATLMANLLHGDRFTAFHVERNDLCGLRPTQRANFSPEKHVVSGERAGTGTSSMWSRPFAALMRARQGGRPPIAFSVKIPAEQSERKQSARTRFPRKGPIRWRGLSHDLRRSHAFLLPGLSDAAVTKKRPAESTREWQARCCLPAPDAQRSYCPDVQLRKPAQPRAVSQKQVARLPYHPRDGLATPISDRFVPQPPAPSGPKP